MKIAIAQINTTIGDFTGNSDKILAEYDRLVKEGAELVVFPELTICGYSPQDFLLKKDFVPRNEVAVKTLAKSIGDVPALVGFIEKNYQGENLFYNAAAWCEDNEIKHVARKCLLPTYGVFNEDRYFKASNEPLVVNFRGKKIGVTICEDIWTGQFREKDHFKGVDPVEQLSRRNLHVHINLTASPWSFNKCNVRHELLTSVSRRNNCPVLYCNQVGGYDQLVFDGRSLVTDDQGRVIKQLKAFEEDSFLIDTENTASMDRIIPCVETISDVRVALLTGLKDFASKSGFERAIVGVSGGIDSTIVAVLATQALGAENVKAYYLPSQYDSERSFEDCEKLCGNLGIDLVSIDIDTVLQFTEKEVQNQTPDYQPTLYHESIHSRCRGMLLSAIAQSQGALLINTANKSELAVGYNTLYGYTSGGLAIIGDLTKRHVYEMASIINQESPVIPSRILERNPLARISDEDALPPFDVLDEVVNLYVEQNLSAELIAHQGFAIDVVKSILQRVDDNEFKRRQAPPILKISAKSFGLERPMPIVHGYRH